MKKNRHILSPSELQAFLGWFEARILSGEPPIRFYKDYLMVLLMVDAGLRVGELCKLELDDLYYYNEPVNCMTLKPGITKNHKERIVPLSARIKAAIISLVQARSVHDCKGKLFSSVRRVQQLVHYAGVSAIGRDVNPHLLRHTFATRLLQRTNLRVVQELLGHSSISSTEIYTHVNHADLASAISKLETPL